MDDAIFKVNTPLMLSKIVDAIPYRTVTDWEAGKRKMPEYVLELMEFKADVEQLKTVNT